MAAPIHDKAIKKRIREMFHTMLMDEEKGKEQYSDGTYHSRTVNAVPVNSQEIFYEQAYKNAAEN